MASFLGWIGLLLGLLVALAGAITFVRGLPDGVELRPGQDEPRGNLRYLLNQESLGAGVALLALDVALRLDNRPFLVPGLLLLGVVAALWLQRRWHRSRKKSTRRAADRARRQP